MQSLVVKRMESVTNSRVAGRVINNLDYFEKLRDDWGDACVLEVCGIMGKSTDTYVLVMDMLVSGVSKLTNIMNGSIPSTDTYVLVDNRQVSGRDSNGDEKALTNMYMSVNDDRICNLDGKVVTLYKKKKDKLRPVNKSHDRGLKPEGVENWKE